ncbi:hypothetical protein HZB60_00725 [candidate division KSB1 bacterium]|nr:hypothetical protein [candidate division KSB1 bacterium]
MKSITLSLLFAVLISTSAPQASAQEPVKPVDISKAQPRVMGLHEQGWQEGVKVGDKHSGKVGWFFAGFGNVPLLWLPWKVEPRHPAKPPVVAEEEFNSGFRNGYRAGWKNSHKTFYIAGMIVSSAAAGAIIASQAD